MNRIVCLGLYIWLVSGLSGLAFVGVVDDQGRYLHYDLSGANLWVSTNVLNPSTHALRFFVASDGYSTANHEGEINEVRSCFAQWQAVPGTALKFEDGGLVAPGVDINTLDGTNVIFWAKNSLFVNGGRDYIHGSLGYTVYDAFDDYTMAEGDIVLNGVEFSWSTNPNPPQGTYFIDGVLLHEIGHLIGLAHSPLGSATMMARGDSGTSLQAGLSTDEIAAVRALYPLPPFAASLAALKGLVTLNGAGILGAVVLIEDSAGNVIQGTVTRQNGAYELMALPPGNYQARITPLDPLDQNSLVTGRDIFTNYVNAQLNFLPSAATAVTLSAGATAFANFAVTGGTPAFRISHLNPPSFDPAQRIASKSPVMINPGQSNLYVGVYSPSLPSAGASLTVTGDGITVGPPTFVPSALPSLNLVYVLISVASTATPGMRSLVVKQDNNIAFANGFLDVVNPIPDNNFDGLDDRFQRQYFPLWTAPEAGPNADPDGDTMNNLAEYMAGTNPVDPNSYLKLQAITSIGVGCTLTWPSLAGKTYQIVARPNGSTGPWVVVSPQIPANGPITQWTDLDATDPHRFYRLQVLP